MGRNKFSQREIDIIRKLLKRKVAGNRGGQKMVRHTLRTVFNFNISDFNVQGQPQRYKFPEMDTKNVSQD